MASTRSSQPDDTAGALVVNAGREGENGFGAWPAAGPASECEAAATARTADGAGAGRGMASSWSEVVDAGLCAATRQPDHRVAGVVLPPFLRQVVSFPAGTRFDTRGARRLATTPARCPASCRWRIVGRSPAGPRSAAGPRWGPRSG